MEKFEINKYNPLTDREIELINAILLKIGEVKKLYEELKRSIGDRVINVG